MTEQLHKGVEWKWSKECHSAFENADILCQIKLTHYNSTLPLLLACDASPVGVGAVIAHRIKDGSERPITFASKMLPLREKIFSN